MLVHCLFHDLLDLVELDLLLDHPSPLWVAQIIKTRWILQYFRATHLFWCWIVINGGLRVNRFSTLKLLFIHRLFCHYILLMLDQLFLSKFQLIGLCHSIRTVHSSLLLYFIPCIGALLIEKLLLNLICFKGEQLWSSFERSELRIKYLLSYLHHIVASCRRGLRRLLCICVLVLLHLKIVCTQVLVQKFIVCLDGYWVLKNGYLLLQLLSKILNRIPSKTSPHIWFLRLLFMSSLNWLSFQIALQNLGLN